jgi:glutathione S-transferase
MVSGLHTFPHSLAHSALYLTTPHPLSCGAEAEGRDAAAVESNRKQLASLLDDAEAQLAKTPFLAGGEYSMADVMASVIIFRTGLAVRRLRRGNGEALGHRAPPGRRQRRRNVNTA